MKEFNSLPVTTEQVQHYFTVSHHITTLPVVIGRNKHVAFNGFSFVHVGNI